VHEKGSRRTGSRIVSARLKTLEWRMAAFNNIKHLVVLMLENRSFDSMLGRLRPRSVRFDGLSLQESNPDRDGNSVAVWTQGDGKPAAMNIPDPDPGELWSDINMQIFGTAEPTPTSAATMDGFVRNYQQQTTEPAERYVANRVMHYYSPEQVPVISRLARQFAVSDRWHASAPCQTWPNRFFVHTGTTDGYENNSPPHFPYEMPTIFNRFEERNVENGWKIYFHDLPQTLTLSGLWPHLDRFRFYDEFRHDASQGTLPHYAFIEPRYFPDVRMPNDQHPPHTVTLGEQLIADAYNSVRNGPNWNETLLIITYDEHGGCYDHVPPPPATPPSDTPTRPFNFDRYGVRVPAVIVSPYIRRGTVLRPTGAIPFDHTSILATLRKCFELGAPLSRRDAVAPDLEPVLSLDEPTNRGPQRLSALAYAASPSDLARAKEVPLNGFQKSLLDLANRLPTDAGSVLGHIEKLRQSGTVAIDDALHVADTFGGDITQAMAAARNRLNVLFGSLGR
jgi:phospholipase C